MKTPRSRNIGLVAFAALMAVAATAAVAQETRYFRIGTGGTAGTYYPVGGLIANAISNPPGSLECASTQISSVGRSAPRIKPLTRSCVPT